MMEMKRIVALVLCLVMLVGYLPVGAQADEVAPAQEPSVITDVVVEEEAADAEENDEESLTDDTGDPLAVLEDEEVVSEENTTSEEEAAPAGDEAAEEEASVEDKTAEEETPAAEETTKEATEEAAAFVLEEVSFVAPLTDADNVIDAAIFCSDVHGSSSTVASVFNAIKNADTTFNPSTASFVGDMDCQASSVTEQAQSVYTGIGCYYAYGSHDSGCGIEDTTGVLYNGTNYAIYAISQSDMESYSKAQSASANFATDIAEVAETKPLFVISHMPLHARRNDNDGAGFWCDAINAEATSRDIVFFWAHNHTGENSTDTAAYYLAKGSSITVEDDSSDNGNSSSTSSKTLAFTYMNAGFIGQSAGRGGVVTTVKIYNNSMVFQDYTSSGAFSGDYSHNVTVTRAYAGSTDSGDSGDSGSTGGTTTETKDVYVLVDTMTVGKDYLIANGNSGTVTLLGQSSGSATTTTAEVKTSGDYTYIETADSGYIWNATAHTNSSYSSYPRLINAETYAMYLSSSSVAFSNSLSSTSGAVYTRYWTYADGVLACPSTNSSSSTYYLTYSGSAFSTTSSSTTGIYIYEKQTITVSSDGTVSGGGDSGDSGDTGDDEDDTTTGGSTETDVGEGKYTTADDGSYQKVTFGTEGEQKEVYVLVNTPTAGNKYLIVSSGSVGNGYALKENTTTGSSVTINAATDVITAPYIETSDNAIVWNATSGLNFQSVNGNYYLNYSSSSSGSHKPGGGSSSYSLSFSTSTASDWTAGTNALYRNGDNNDYYLRCNDGTWAMGSSNNTYNVYFYEYQKIDTSTSVTYSVTASDIEHFLDDDDTTAETATIAASVTDGAPDGTYSYTILSDEKGIISDAIASDGTVTFTGTEGTAQVKVSYTWAAETDVNADGTVDDEDTYTIWQVIDVTATAPYYTLDLHKADAVVNEVTGLTSFDSDKTYYTKNKDGTYTQVAENATPDSSVTYYYVTYELGDEITAPIAIKGVEAGDRYGVWAVITGYDGVLDSEGNDGEELGEVGNAIEWSSSDESIATVDPVTGIITFTGKEGTVEITADYAYGTEGKLATDTITISVTQSLYNVPADGTTDFPEYPNEGAIRYDKTATAVGNFSETGIAQVELSMTGVPYTTGSEIDVVIMLDMTGSMSTESMEAAEVSALAFADQIVKNTDESYNKNRISVQMFTTNGVTELWALNAVTADTYSTLENAIESASTKQAEGGTPYSTALKACYEILYAAKSDGTGNNRQQFCVFVSDGTPTSVTYITNTSTPASTTTVSFTRNNATYTQTVPAYSTGSSTSTFESSDNSYHEYWSQLMMNNDVTVYGVYTSASAGSSGSGGGSVNDTTAGKTCMNKVASSTDKVYVVDDYTDTSALTGVFTSIAKEIMQAATDITVEDKINDEYTMIFSIPTDTNYNHTISTTQEFYIEFLTYTLDATTHERTNTGTTVTKLYLIDSNGSTAGGTYSAGSTATTAYAAPVFENKVIGDKGTLYYWTTDTSYSDEAALSYNDGTNTYYFIPYGIDANHDDYDSEKWFNMTSGAYANGTINEVTNTSTNLVIATPYFVYNASSRMLYWTLDKMQDATTEYALRYFLYLDDSATDVSEDTETPAGPYPTNDHAYITYTNFQGNDCQQKFPVPQLTWNGAQVSYVFYLVNSNGEPINKSGQVVDFANATFITDVFTEHVIWNDPATDKTAAGFAYLDATYKASELLPTEYTLYDTSAYYELYVYEDAEGNTLDNYFKITGSEANGSTSSTTKVYITKGGTKYSAYGTYNENNVYTGFDFGNTTVAFAVVWQPTLVPDVVVVDYGLDVLINVVQNDLMQNTISGIGKGADAYGGTTMNTGVSTASKLGTAALSIDGNTISIENENQIRFHQGDMQFQNAVEFYYESPVEFYESSDKREGYMYSSVTVIPATTIYYEDEYVTLETYNAEYAQATDVTADNFASGVYYTGDSTTDTYTKATEYAEGTTYYTRSYTKRAGWDVSSVKATATQDQDRPGKSQISKDLDADNVYGYDSAYKSMSTHSLDSAAMVHVDDESYATASFSFYGTGFDVISMTSNTTGVLAVKVVNESGTKEASNMVNTYYGYTTEKHEIVYTYTNGAWVSEDKGVATDETVVTAKPENPAEGSTYTAIEQVWVVTPDTENALYQVPVLQIEGLTYGLHTVTITATYAESLDKTSADGYDLYLDAIRIYDPANDGASDKTIQDAYVADGEGWPSYIELRNKMIGKDTFGYADSESDTKISGVVFIDGDISVADDQISDYTSYGPNNEVYLAKNQSIAFILEKPSADIVKNVHLGVKSANGDDVTYTIKNVAKAAINNVAAGESYGEKSFTVKTSTDMYYDITGWSNDIIVITNKSSSDAILSLTNIKATYTENPNGVSLATSGDAPLVNTAAEEPAEETGNEVDVYMTPNAAKLTLLSLSKSEEEEPEVTEPDVSVPETTEPEETEPEDTTTETTEPEDATTETTEPEETKPENQKPTQNSVIKYLANALKKLFGGWFR